jgi:superfamily II DNA or RNA helicase
MANPILDSRLHIPIDAEHEGAIAWLRSATDHANPGHAKALRMGREAPERIVSHEETQIDGVLYLSVPRGLYPALLPPEVADRRVKRTSSIGATRSRVELRPYQRALIDAAKAEETCLWRAGQGAGKTTAALALIAELGQRALVVVHTATLARQWAERCEAELGIVPGAIGDGRWDLRDVTIGMAQTLRTSMHRIPGDFGILVVDEVQTAGAPTYSEIVDRCPAFYRVGISGDERRADGREFLIYESFGEVACEVPNEELIALGNVHAVEVRVVLSQFRSEQWDRACAAVVEARDSRNVWEQRKAARGREAAHSRLLGELGSDRVRNEIVTGLVLECAGEGEAVIVLTSRREHASRIEGDLVARTQLRTGLLLGGKPSLREFGSTLDGLRSGNVRVAIGTYQAIGVGFDVPRIARGICTMPVAGNRKGEQQWKQYRGRFARPSPGKRDAVLYYIHDEACFGKGPIANLVKWNDRVVVRVGSDWVSGKEWLKQHGNKATKRRDNDGTDDLFEHDAGGQNRDSTAGAGVAAPRTRRKRSEVTGE